MPKLDLGLMNGFMKKNRKLIKDRTMKSQGFSCFAASSVKEDGLVVEFLYPSGDRYRVSIDYLLQWCIASPHQGTVNAVADERAIRSRKISEGHMVRVFMSDGRAFDVAWDVVLMACEPRYEHYGGLTQESKVLVSRGPAARRAL